MKTRRLKTRCRTWLAADSAGMYYAGRTWCRVNRIPLDRLPPKCEAVPRVWLLNKLLKVRAIPWSRNSLTFRYLGFKA